MTVIIGANIVVYALCKCARRFNPSPIYIEVGFAKVWVFFCEFEVRGVQICFAKAHEVFHKMVIYKARVNFLKTEGVFCKIDIHNSIGSFCKLSSMAAD